MAPESTTISTSANRLASARFTTRTRTSVIPMRHPPRGSRRPVGRSVTSQSLAPEHCARNPSTSPWCRRRRESSVWRRGSGMHGSSAAKHTDPAAGERLFDAVREAERFFMGTDAVHRALEKLVGLLAAGGISYALVGAMALNEYGYRRVTVAGELLLTREGVEAFKRAHLGRGYLEKFPGSRGMPDTENGVDIDVVLAGEYPGDGKPKPVAFPDPATAAIEGARVRLLPLPKLIELRLASGMSAPHRLRDLADVLEIIRIQQLPEDFAVRLDPFVRDKFRELWQAAQHADQE